MNKTLLIIFSVLLIISSCTSGPKPKSPLNYLNGENYRSQQVVGGAIPLNYERVDRNTIVRGQCFFNKSDDYNHSVRFKKIIILKNDKVLQEAVTDSQGNFTFSLQLANGDYILKISDKDYSGQMTINISNYLAENIYFKVQNNETK